MDGYGWLWPSEKLAHGILRVYMDLVTWVYLVYICLHDMVLHLKLFSYLFQVVGQSAYPIEVTSVRDLRSGCLLPTLAK